MHQLISVLAVTFPIFALVVCGFVAIRRELLPVNAIPGLGSYVVSFALPALLFRMGMSTPLQRLLDGPLVLVYLGCAAVIVSATIVFSRNKRVRLKDAAFGALASVYPNAGFMGIPLLVALLGEAGVRIVLVTVLVDLFLVTSSCIAIVQMPEGSSGSGVLRTIWRAFVGALRGALANPLPWPIAAGLVCGAFGVTVPGPVDKAVAMLGDTASPVALFAIGCILARNAVTAAAPIPAGDYVPAALVKLLVHPALVYGFGLVVQALGFALDSVSLAGLAVVAALPPAINITMLAERFGADSGRVARIVMLATVLSFVTITVTVWLLGLSPSSAA